jgi:TPP-dependent pyruvate/acetoin dehydrogenase alpha subunit
MSNTIDDDERIECLYEMIAFIRRVEEEVARVYPSDKIKSPVHLSIGMEAISVGVCDVLEPEDYVSGTYRGHAAYLAKGAPLREMIAEMYGKATGSARGKGGSMHLINADHNVIGASAVVGTNIPIAAGHAFALKRQGTGKIVVCFFGDGATEEGVFTETVNFAALHKLPILFVCENNFYAIHEPIEKRQATDRLAERVGTFGIETRQIRDGDVFAIRDTAAELIADIRAGKGPAFMECHSYRWREHVGPNEDYDAGYRSEDELKPWRETDQVVRLAGMVSPERKAEIDADIARRIEEAFAFAEESLPPDPSELNAHVFAE